MFVRLGGIGVVLAGISIPALLTIGFDGHQPAATASAATAAAQDEPASVVPKTAQKPDAPPAQGTANLSALFSDLASKSVSSYVPTSLLDWEISPLAALAAGSHLTSLFGNHSSGPLPAELASAEFSRGFLEAYFQRAVERDSPVDDEVLGLRIKGRSHLTGTVHLVWHEAEQPPGFDLIFAGVCHSQTDGLHEVVTLHNQAETKFEASKSFVWSDAGLETLPAVATAETHSKTVNIDSSLPGFIGRIATGIAHDRADERRVQADAISGRHAAERIARGFDRRVDRQMAVLQVISHHLPAGGYLRQATRFAMNSTPDALHFGLYRRDAAKEGRSAWLMPESCDAAIRLHRRVFELALADRTGLSVLGAVLLQFVANESQDLAQPTAAADISSAVPRAHWRLARSADGEWLLVEHFSPQPAGESSPVGVPQPVPASPVSQQRPLVR